MVCSVLIQICQPGSDIVTAIIQNKKDPTTEDGPQKQNDLDEIMSYLNCRYTSAVDACWQISQFDIHHREPVVERLPFHLEDEHTIISEENAELENILNKPGIEETKFTTWMEANSFHSEARSLTYVEFP